VLLSGYYPPSHLQHDAIPVTTLFSGGGGNGNIYCAVTYFLDLTSIFYSLTFANFTSLLLTLKMHSQSALQKEDHRNRGVRSCLCASGPQHNGVWRKWE